VKLADWFKVELSDEGMLLDVRPPGKSAWKQSFPWSSVQRVCFRSEDFTVSDELYIFTSLRPESFLIPTEAAGGDKLMDELIRRGLFPAEVAIQAARAPEGEILCWPPLPKQ